MYKPAQIKSVLYSNCRGGDGNDDDAFRVWFSRIGEARSCFCDARMLAFTATASNLQRRKIKDSLAMPKRCYELLDSPDRENIQLNVHKISNKLLLTDIFKFLIDKAKNEKENMARYVVFCHCRKTQGKLYGLFDRLNIPTYLFNMLHSSTTKGIRDKIREQFDGDSKLRILFASKSAGMGVNLSGVNNVIHFGPPRDVDSFVQELGRAGRSGQQAQEILIYNGYQLNHLEPEMRVYIQNSTKCRRKSLMSLYNQSSVFDGALHWCCDVCRASCDCETDCETNGSFDALIITVL